MVTVTVSPLKIFSFKATPTYIDKENPPQQIELQWQTNNATLVHISENKSDSDNGWSYEPPNKI